jgi:two-component system response regulator DegU
MELAASHTPVAGAIRQAWGLATSVNALIVDDNEGIRRLLRRAIREIADPIWECCDGADALKSYIDRRPDIVLMDIRMPIVDGLEATRRILKFDPEARVMIVTDYDDDDLREVALEAGACGYWLKEEVADLPQKLLSIAGK